jgi:hypothetical protein
VRCASARTAAVPAAPFLRVLASTDPAIVAQSADMRAPHVWYPSARAQKRRLVAHVGPTNSGKTHAALAALAAAPSGVYAAPLRLLAWEQFERLRQSVGPACALVTGQERDGPPDATHVSCTVEMADVGRRVAVGVLDEAQLLGDASRGWAWTRVLLGLPADELHLCGDAAVLPLLRRLAAVTGEELTVKTYARLVPLAVEPRALRSWAEARTGDCVVAFSRRALFETKGAIEAATGLRCGVIYGALPPAVRRAQARAFNEGGDDAAVLVATDAVGMGLNLAIRRVVFVRTHKFDGTHERDLTVSELRQIAGRAGRFGGAFPEGRVAALAEADMRRLRHALGTPSAEVRIAGLAPSAEQLEVFAMALAAPASRARLRRQRDAWARRASEAAAVTAATVRDDAATRTSAADDAHRALTHALLAALDEQREAVLRGRAPRDLPPALAAHLRTLAAAAAGAPPAEAAAGAADGADAPSASAEDEDGNVEEEDEEDEEGDSRDVSFSDLLELYVAVARVDASLYFLCDGADMVALARVLDPVPGLSLRTRFVFAQAPSDPDVRAEREALARFARAFAAGRSVLPGVEPPAHPPRSPAELAQHETVHAVLDTYLWFARRFPRAFRRADAVEGALAVTEAHILDGLRAMGPEARDVARARRRRQRRGRGDDDDEREGEGEGRGKGKGKGRRRRA